MDSRLRGTKCEGCLYGHYFTLDNAKFTECADCKDRPNRGQDASRFRADVETQFVKNLLDEDAKKDSKKSF